MTSLSLMSCWSWRTGAAGVGSGVALGVGDGEGDGVGAARLTVFDFGPSTPAELTPQT